MLGFLVFRFIHLKTSGGQPVALGCFGVWLGGYFLARLIIFVFVDFRAFLRKICSMIPLIVFVFVDFRVLWKICSMIALIIFVFGDLCIFYERFIP